MKDMQYTSYNVRATIAQSIRWKQAADQAGHRSVGTWLAESINRYLELLATMGLPVPLVWQRGSFKVTLPSGETSTVRGHISPPFGCYPGGQKGFNRHTWMHTLVYVPTGRPLATLRTYAQAKQLAAELSRMWIKWDGRGDQPEEDLTAVLARHIRESM